MRVGRVDRLCPGYIESIPGNGIHDEINTRAELREHDRPLHDLIARYFADDAWRPRCP
ncbi:hypothetical protein WMF20_04710 [Sorangium sp. So ce834]|uniref:hypothetical protein n=1 Tax=Sorangium sp. So ce834 TaxID=3133321 RepID=UPI003F5DC634